MRLDLQVAFDLVLCGVLAAGLPFLAHRLQPDFRRATLVAGLVGGGLTILWVCLGRHCLRIHRWAIVTLVAMAFMFVRQAVQCWSASNAFESKGRIVAVLMVVLVVFCLGMVADLVRDAKIRKHE